MLEVMGESHEVNHSSQRESEAKEGSVYPDSTCYRLHAEKQAETKERKMEYKLLGL